MEILNGKWVDDNNNSWDSDKYTKDEVLQLSKTLINCYDCSHCSHCYDCFYCYDCYTCYDCYACSHCYDCSDCSACSACHDCSDCSDCSHCSACSACSYCSACSACSHCYDCSHCSACSDFKKQPNIFSKQLKYKIIIYWTKNKELLICGCYKTTNINNFIKEVEMKYPADDSYDKSLYLKFINDYNKIK